MKTVFFDIEAGGLKAPFDQVICAAFKPYAKPAYVISRDPQDEDDKKLCCKIRDELAKYDIVVTYYGLDYDKPFLNARLLKFGEKPLKRQLHLDCYRLAKKLFKYALHSKRLVVICEMLGIKGKTRVEPAHWEKMKYSAVAGKEEPLKLINTHCKADVEALEKAYDKCFRYAVSSISLA